MNKLNRIEFNVRTRMSERSGINSASDFIKKAADMGHKAIAITDLNSVQSFPEAEEAGREYGIKIIYGVEVDVVDVDYIETKDVLDDNGYTYTKLIYPEVMPKSHKTLIYVKKQSGLHNLYKLISESYSTSFYETPKVLKSRLAELRDGLLICPGSYSNELIEGIKNGEPEEKLKEIASFYDFLTINNADFDFDYDYLWGKIIRLGDGIKKPVIVIGCASYLSQKDYLANKIITESYLPKYLRNDKANHRVKNEVIGHEYGDVFLDTDDMIERISYLTKLRTEEIVIKNPNLICDSIEEIKIFPKEKQKIEIEGADSKLRELVMKSAGEIYGEKLTEIVAKRIEKELAWIINNDNSSIFLIANEIAEKNNKKGEQIGFMGVLGSSLVAYLSKVTDVNPLSSHYICTSCKHSEFILDSKYYTCQDLPDKNCRQCGMTLQKEGYNIPSESFFGLNGERDLDITLNISTENLENTHKYLKNHVNKNIGENKIFYCGRVNALGWEESIKKVEKFYQKKEIEINRKTMDATSRMITGKKISTEIMSNTILLIRKDKEIFDFTPVEVTGENLGIPVTHHDYSYLLDFLSRIDLVPSYILPILKNLEKSTGIKRKTINLSDPKVLNLFSSNDVWVIPGFQSPYVMNIIKESGVQSFSDLVKIFGIVHGTRVWEGNGQDIIKSEKGKLSDLITTREDVFNDLLNAGADIETAFNGMKSLKINKNIEQLDLPEWYLESLDKIYYLFTKAHCVHFTKMYVQLGWYKLYYPSEFYSTILHYQNLELEVNDEDYYKELIEYIDDLEQEMKFSNKVF